MPPIKTKCKKDQEHWIFNFSLTQFTENSELKHCHKCTTLESTTERT